MDANQFSRNAGTHTLDELSPYLGKHVAWSEDGSQILASASTLSDLYAELDRKSITDYITDFIPPADEGFLGGTAF